jgi:hypothetical protein
MKFLLQNIKRTCLFASTLIGSKGQLKLCLLTGEILHRDVGHCQVIDFQMNLCLMTYDFH